MNISNLMDTAGRVFGKNSAISVGNEVYCTYGDLALRIKTMAGQFRNRFQLNSGDRIALVMENCPSFLEVLYAAWYAGLCVVPINAKLHAREFQYILENSGSKLCFVTSGLEDTIVSLSSSISTLKKVISVSSPDFKSFFLGDTIEIQECSPDATAWIFYTSGTTGRPKGAMLSHRNLMTMTLGYFANVDSISSKDCIIHLAPMSHGSGLYNFPHVVKGAVQVIPTSKRFDPGEILDLIGSYTGVSFFAAPTLVKRLVEHPRSKSIDTTNLKTIVYGGGPMYVADLKQALDCFGYNKFVEIYGQGESPMTITSLSKAHHADTGHPRFKQRLASVGVAQSSVQIRIADENDRPVPSGKLGEILVKGDVVMTGYWNNPEATRKTLRGGWLHTGDIGFLDSDGFLTLKDRSNDLIISGGANIYPREVEEILLKHDAVQEVSVIGRQNLEWGEEVVAFVVVKAGVKVTEEELDKICLKNIARFKRPRSYRFIDYLPKNNYGKILKTELRRKIQNTRTLH